MTGTKIATGTAEFFIYLGTGGPELFRVQIPDTPRSFREDSRIVLHEGESAYVRALVSDCVWAMFGYLLTGTGAPLVPGQLPAP